MSAVVLREAATLMRSRAEAATPGPWKASEAQGATPRVRQVLGTHSLIHDDAKSIALIPGFASERELDAAHIASWHPAVALAVADWLDAAAVDEERFNAEGAAGFQGENPAFAVARAYLAHDPP